MTRPMQRLANRMEGSSPDIPLPRRKSPASAPSLDRAWQSACRPEPASRPWCHNRAPGPPRDRHKRGRTPTARQAAEHKADPCSRRAAYGQGTRRQDCASAVRTWRCVRLVMTLPCSCSAFAVSSSSPTNTAFSDGLGSVTSRSSVPAQIRIHPPRSYGRSRSLGTENDKFGIGAFRSLTLSEASGGCR